MEAQPLDKDAMNREFARMSGMLYDLNPRNFEDRWYALVGIELNMLCRKIKCNAVATAQDSIWAGNTYADPIKLANVMVKLDTVSKGLDGNTNSTENQASPKGQADEPEDQGDAEQDFMIDDVGEHLLDQDAFATFDNPENGSVLVEGHEGPVMEAQDSQTQHDAVPSASQETNDDVKETDNQAGGVQQGEGQDTTVLLSGSAAGTVTGGNRHRVPDSAINGFVSIDFDRIAMAEVTESRQEWTTKGAQFPHPASAATQPSHTKDIPSHTQSGNSQGFKQATESISAGKPPSQAMDCTTKAIHNELKKLPPIDPNDYDVLRNPYPLYRGRRVVEFKLLNAESKRLPSRQESTKKPPWHNALEDLMDSAQCGNLEQIRVFFASPQWQHQNSVLLLATAGDFQTYTIATREPDTEKATFSILPWSLPVWFGSEACQRREEKILNWINTTYSPEAMMKIALELRDEAAAHPQPAREKTPEEGNADGENGPSGPSGASLPSDPPAAPTNEKRKRGRSKTKGTQPTRLSKRPRKGNTQVESVATPVPTHIPDAEVSGADEGRLAQDNARDDAAAQSGPSAPLGPSPPPHPTGKTRVSKRLPGGDDPGTSKPVDKGKGKARADPIDESQQDSDDDGPPLSPVLEADEGSDSDEDRPARKKARTQLSSEGPPSTVSPSPIENDVQPAPLASTQPVASTSTNPAASSSTQPASLASNQPVASTSTNPAASSSTQPAPSTSTQPAASTSTRRPPEHRESTRVSRPVKIFDASGKKDAAERYKKLKLKRARSTMN